MLSFICIVIGCQIPELTSNDSTHDAGNHTREDAGQDAWDTQNPATGDVGADADAADIIVEPHVAFAAPTNGTTMDNPVVFQIVAVGVDEVEIFADETYSKETRDGSGVPTSKGKRRKFLSLPGTMPSSFPSLHN